jgi:hypothetical protein
MLVFGRENWRHHVRWCIGTSLVVAASALAYIAYGLGSGHWSWPGGASPPGFALGLLGGFIIGFEMLLWPRKSWFRGWRLGRTKTWMAAHIWLGLLTIPLLLLHGGFNFNVWTSTLAALLMWLLILVVGSGIFGLVLQNVVPRLMLEQLPAETIYGEIEHVLAEYRKEAARLVEMTCGRSVADSRSGVGEAVVGAYASNVTSRAAAGKSPKATSQATPLHLGNDLAAVPESDALFHFYRDQIEPYLHARPGKQATLGSAANAAAMFQALKDRLPDEAQEALDRLEAICVRRRQFDLQARLHFWLHSWLGVHVALSLALTLLMIVHAILALKYA